MFRGAIWRQFSRASAQTLGRATSLSCYNRGPRRLLESHAHDRRHPYLVCIEKGDRLAAEQLLPLVYDELRRLATRKMASEKGCGTGPYESRDRSVAGPPHVGLDSGLSREFKSL